MEKRLVRRLRSTLFPLALAAGALTFARAPRAAPKTALEFPKDKVALDFEKYTLDNGLEVVLHEDRRTPVVAVNLWYHVGSKDEPAGRNGFAHLFEHLMFQGSRHVAEDTFFKYLERAGASEHNGTTSDDRTNYFETLPQNQLELALWLESDRMGFLLDHVNDETFKSQREVVKNERRQNYENAPYGLVHQFIRAAVFPPGHPYRLLPIGTPEDLNAATLDDVRQFFKTFYVPNNATLVIAGDIQKEKTKELVLKYFGALPRGAAPPVKKGPVAAEIPAEKHLDVQADVELGRLIMTWSTPRRFAPGDSDLDLVAQLLTEGKTSRLYKRLVYDMQIAQSVSAYQDSDLLASTFEIGVTLKKGKDPKAALRVIDEELEKLRKTPPSDDELARAKAQTLSRLVFEMERVTAKANALNEYNQTAGDPGYFAKDVARYTAATAPDLVKAMELLPAAHRVVTVVTPTPGAPRAGRLAGAS
jgi:zinc protease